MYCSKCGEEISNSKFCKYCGNRILSVEQEVETTPPNIEHIKEFEDKPTWKIITCIITAIVSLIMVFAPWLKIEGGDNLNLFDLKEIMDSINSLTSWFGNGSENEQNYIHLVSILIIMGIAIIVVEIVVVAISFVKKSFAKTIISICGVYMMIVSLVFIAMIFLTNDTVKYLLSNVLLDANLIKCGIAPVVILIMANIQIAVS